MGDEWFRLDCSWLMHPKVIGLPATTKLLFIAGLGYSASSGTDGHIPAGALPLLAAAAGSSKPAVGQLVDRGLWHKEAAGWEIHEYLEYQRSSASRAQKREADRERQRKSRAKRDEPVTVTDMSRRDEPVTDVVTPERVTLAQTDRQTTLQLSCNSRPQIPGAVESESEMRRATAIAQTVLEVVPRCKPDAALDVVWWALHHVDIGHLESWVQSLEQLDERPRSVTYVATMVRQRAKAMGIDVGVNP